MKSRRIITLQSNLQRRVKTLHIIQAGSHIDSAKHNFKTSHTVTLLSQKGTKICMFKTACQVLLKAGKIKAAWGKF
jgi:hypothetical protein